MANLIGNICENRLPTASSARASCRRLVAMGRSQCVWETFLCALSGMDTLTADAQGCASTGG